MVITILEDIDYLYVFVILFVFIDHNYSILCGHTYTYTHNIYYAENDQQTVQSSTKQNPFAHMERQKLNSP